MCYMSSFHLEQVYNKCKVFHVINDHFKDCFMFQFEDHCSKLTFGNVHVYHQFYNLFYSSEASCSKLTTSLINILKHYKYTVKILTFSQHKHLVYLIM